MDTIVDIGWMDTIVGILAGWTLLLGYWLDGHYCWDIGWMDTIVGILAGWTLLLGYWLDGHYCWDIGWIMLMLLMVTMDFGLSPHNILPDKAAC